MSDDTKVENKSPKNITLGLVVSWILGIVFGVGGLIIVFTVPITGIVALIASVIILPPVNKVMKEKFNFSLSGWLKFAIVAILFGIVLFVPMDKEESSTQEVTAPQASQSTQERTEPAIKVSALTLSEEYEANQVSADAKYKDKQLEISGVVESIGKDILDTPYITLEGKEFSIFGVQCMFSEEDESKLATLFKGQRIVVQGKTSGEFIGGIIVRGCKIVEN